MTKKYSLSYSTDDLDNYRWKGVVIPVQQVGRREGREGGEAFIPIRLLTQADELVAWNGNASEGSSPFFGQGIAIWDETGHVVCGVQHAFWVTVQHVAALEVPGLGREGSIRRWKAPRYCYSSTTVKQGCATTSASHIRRYSQKQLRQGLSIA